MGIIITRNGSQAIKLDPVAFAAESHLQSYIAANPECIPVDQIENDLHLLILGREFPTGSGPVDVLAMDATGMLYLIETKLYKNPDKRRVVAQVLDYGAALWAAGGDTVARELSAFVGAARRTGESGASLDERIADAFDLSSEEVQEALAELERNISSGRLRFMVLMDTIDDRLKDLIRFINESSSFELLAIEVEFYQHDEFEVMIPRLFGAEARKATGRARRGRWNDESFKEQIAKAGVPAEERNALDWAVDFANRLEARNIAQRSYATGLNAMQQVRGENSIVFKFGIVNGHARFNLPMYLWRGDRTEIESALEDLSKATGESINYDPTRRGVPILESLVKTSANRPKVEAALVSLTRAL